jgi:hypothetical protein
VCCAVLLRSEEVQLKDGSKLSGKLTAIDGNTFLVKTSYGEIKIPRSEVVAIRFPENEASRDTATSKENADNPAVDESLMGTSYSNRTGHFQVNVPAGWSVAPELRKSKDVVSALKSEDLAYFFLVTQEKYAGSLKTYQVLAETHFQSKFQEFDKLSESDAKVDGREGSRTVFTGKNGPTELKFLVFIVPYNDTMVRLTFFTLAPLFNDAVPTFEKIAQSYHATSEKPVAAVTTLPAR